MHWKRPCREGGGPLAAALGLALLLAGPSAARATDHRDGAVQLAAPETDLLDLYAWMSPDRRLVHIVLTAFPDAGSGARFSEAALYVIHAASRQKFTDSVAQNVRQEIVCQFDAQQRIRCWLGADYVEGDPSSPGGLVSRGGLFRVFAGPRQDVSFFNLDGLAAFRSTLKGYLTGGQITTIDANGCPLIPSALRPGLSAQLRERPGAPGAAPQNAYAGKTALALVLSVDSKALSAGGSILSLWAGTHKVGAP